MPVLFVTLSFKIFVLSYLWAVMNFMGVGGGEHVNACGKIVCNSVSLKIVPCSYPVPGIAVDLVIL